MIFCSEPSLKEKLVESTVFLDNNALIAMMEVPEILSFFSEIIDNGCQFLTISAVVAEFSATDKLEKYNARIEFVNNLCSVYPIERHIDPADPLLFVLNKVSGKPGYTDILLQQALIKFPTAYLLTENYKDFPLAIFDRKFTVTVDTRDQVRNQCFHQVNVQRLDVAAKNLLNTT